MIQIAVQAEDPVSPQARRYAEYRVFAALLPLTPRLHPRQATVALRKTNRPGECAGIECAITVIVGDTAFRVRATGDHPYDAINRAADRLSPTRLMAGGARERDTDLVVRGASQALRTD
jgi:hypothetical protein